MAKITDITAGLTILARYQRDSDDPCAVSAEHDEITCCGPQKVDPADRAALKRLGWSWNAEFDCWSKFT